jgi:transposase
MPVTERREAERSEADRSGVAGITGAPEPAPSSRPDPEVSAEAKRRTFTAEYKQRILTEADAVAKEPGAIGALLRREGLYSSHLTSWRRERAAGVVQGLTPRRRGPRSRRSPEQDEIERLQRVNQRLAEQLRKAEIIIDVQKKVAALLGRTLPEIDPDKES